MGRTRPVAKASSGPIVFLGPSLDLLTARKLFPATYREPAQRGDIAEAVSDGFDPIVLIDGAMVESHPPSPKEVAEAISIGRCVVGAASLGAIRAAELRKLGMYGVGWVYDRYVRIPLVGDDEVLTLNCPETWESITVPYVRVLYGLEKLVESGALSITSATSLAKRVKETHFRNRTWSAIAAWAYDLGVPRVVVDRLASVEVDIKRIDTIECLQQLSKSTVLGHRFSLSQELKTGGSSLLRRARKRWLKPASRLSKQAAFLLARRTELGISRIGETTWLDITGVPSYCCVAPGTTDDIWVYSGKGLTRGAAVISCMLEAVERRAPLWRGTQRIVRTKAEIPSGSRIWGPEMFTLCIRENPKGGEFYCPAVLPGRQGVVWVPAELVFTGNLAIPRNSRTVSVLTSNGLGAGFSREAARTKALMEVIERDILSLHEIASSHAAMLRLGAIAGALGIRVGGVLADFVDNNDTTSIVDPETLPMSARRIMHRFLNAGVKVVVHSLPNDYGLPAFAAAALMELSWGKLSVCAGYAVNANRDRAVVGAILELAQTRATDFQGGREDRHHLEKERWKKPRRHWLLSNEGAICALENTRWPNAVSRPRLQHYLYCVKRAGLPLVAFADFPAPNGLFVSRAIVPDAETWHASAGRSKFGTRGRIAARTGRVVVA